MTLGEKMRKCDDDDITQREFKYEIMQYARSSSLQINYFIIFTRVRRRLLFLRVLLV